MISWKDGEELAASYLKKHGYCIEERNYRTRRGEIDIIASRDNSLVCIEVKTWKKMTVDSMEYSINGKKQRTYIQLCKSFINQTKRFDSFFIRFDVMHIDASTGNIEHIEDAFWENG